MKQIRWTSAMEERLRKLRALGKTHIECADLLGVSFHAIKRKVEHLKDRDNPGRVKKPSTPPKKFETAADVSRKLAKATEAFLRDLEQCGESQPASLNIKHIGRGPWA